MPRLAESWRLVDDTTWQLKPGAASSSTTAALQRGAVRFTFQRVLDPEQKSPNRANMTEIAWWTSSTTTVNQ